MNATQSNAIPAYRKVQIFSLGFVALIQVSLLSTNPEFVDAKIVAYAMTAAVMAEIVHRIYVAIDGVVTGLQAPKKQQKRNKSAKKAKADEIPADPVKPSVRNTTPATVQKTLFGDAEPVRPANIPAHFVLVKDPVYGDVWSAPKK